MHIPDDPLYYEKYYFTPGDLGFKVWDVKYGRIGVLVCWDQCSRVPERASDWVELYNAGDRPVDLQGMRLVIAGRQHVIEGSIKLPAKGRQLLFCDGRPGKGYDHVGFKLPRSGGTVLLVDADGGRVLDLFTWPSTDGGMSVGRLPDGGREWSYFAAPSPGKANQRPGAVPPIQRRCPPPEVDVQGGMHDGPLSVSFFAPEGCSVHYTRDGSRPTRDHAARADGPITLTESTVLRARAFGEDQLDGEERCDVHLIKSRPGRPMMLTGDPADLWSDSAGIATPGAASNHTRTGLSWERPAHIQDADGASIPIGLRISGSGSRGLAKRSFKVFARDRYGSPEAPFRFADGTQCDEGMLRADASPDAFLRNRFLEVLVARFGLQVDMQPSEVRELYINAAYWGLYRWMPPKDAQWLRQVSAAEDVDVLEGPAASVMAGDADLYEKALGRLVSAAPMDSIDDLIDLRSLIDLAVLDLWTGRADHDLNVRCYRPRRPGGRWRWVLFDMDLWSTPSENTVERMCSATLPEAPFVPQLLGHAQLQERLLARLSAMQAVVLDPQFGRQIIDSLYQAHALELADDHERWRSELDRDRPEDSLERMREFIADRSVHLVRQMAIRTGRRSKMVIIDVPDPVVCRIELEGLPLRPGRQVVHCFSGVPMTIEAIVSPGYEWRGWRGGTEGATRMCMDLARAGQLSPRVVPLSP